jgi:hypothetical protein
MESQAGSVSSAQPTTNSDCNPLEQNKKEGSLVEEEKMGGMKAALLGSKSECYKSFEMYRKLALYQNAQGTDFRDNATHSLVA